jgi:hypothetical protein
VYPVGSAAFVDAANNPEVLIRCLAPAIAKFTAH